MRINFRTCAHYLEDFKDYCPTSSQGIDFNFKAFKDYTNVVMQVGVLKAYRSIPLRVLQQLSHICLVSKQNITVLLLGSLKMQLSISLIQL